MTESDRAPAVLVVDDDADVRDSVSEVLRDEGFTVSTASNGAEALRALREGMRPGLILLDLMMPVMDGFEFCRIWKKDPHISDIPVVLLSADAATEARAKECGASGFLRKPVELATLVETANTWTRPS